MENKKTIAELKVPKDKNHETRGQKFVKWWKNKAMPWIRARFEKLNSLGRDSHPTRLSTVLVLAILVYMTNNGEFDDMPNAKWMVECCVRVMEYIFGAFRWIVEHLIHVLDSEFVNIIDIFGLNEILSNIMKAIFGM